MSPPSWSKHALRVPRLGPEALGSNFSLHWYLGSLYRSHLHAGDVKKGLHNYMVELNQALGADDRTISSSQSYEVGNRPAQLQRNIALI